jgi:hypothetical protein
LREAAQKGGRPFSEGQRKRHLTPSGAMHKRKAPQFFVKGIDPAPPKNPLAEGPRRGDGPACYAPLGILLIIDVIFSPKTSEAFSI